MDIEEDGITKNIIGRVCKKVTRDAIKEMKWSCDRYAEAREWKTESIKRSHSECYGFRGSLK